MVSRRGANATGKAEPAVDAAPCVTENRHQPKTCDQDRQAMTRSMKHRAAEALPPAPATGHRRIRMGLWFLGAGLIGGAAVALALLTDSGPATPDFQRLV